MIYSRVAKIWKAELFIIFFYEDFINYLSETLKSNPGYIPAKPTVIRRRFIGLYIFHSLDTRIQAPGGKTIRVWKLYFEKMMTGSRQRASTHSWYYADQGHEHAYPLLTENSSHQTENHLILFKVLPSGKVNVMSFLRYRLRTFVLSNKRKS